MSPSSREIRLSQYARRKDDPEYRARILLNSRRSSRRRKRKVIEAYGGRCVCCGETALEFLTLDHPNHDGKEHRALCSARGASFYKYLIDHNFPFKNELRVLCQNCNFAEGVYGYCPHQEDRLDDWSLENRRPTDLPHLGGIARAQQLRSEKMRAIALGRQHRADGKFV